jgi:hypothetical protein
LHLGVINAFGKKRKLGRKILLTEKVINDTRLNYGHDKLGIKGTLGDLKWINREEQVTNQGYW